MTSVVGARDLEIEFSDFDNGRMWTSHLVQWVGDGLVLPVGGGTEALIYDVDTKSRDGRTPGGSWRATCPLTGTEDVIALTARGLARVTPSTMEARWKR